MRSSTLAIALLALFGMICLALAVASASLAFSDEEDFADFDDAAEEEEFIADDEEDDTDSWIASLLQDDVDTEEFAESLIYSAAEVATRRATKLSALNLLISVIEAAHGAVSPLGGEDATAVSLLVSNYLKDLTAFQKTTLTNAKGCSARPAATISAKTTLLAFLQEPSSNHDLCLQTFAMDGIAWAKQLVTANRGNAAMQDRWREAVIIINRLRATSIEAQVLFIQNPQPGNIRTTEQAVYYLAYLVKVSKIDEDTFNMTKQFLMDKPLLHDFLSVTPAYVNLSFRQLSSAKLDLQSFAPMINRGDVN